MLGWKKKYDKMVENYNRLKADYNRLHSITEYASARAIRRIEELKDENEIYKLKCKVMESVEDVQLGTELVNELQDKYNARYGNSGSSKNADTERDESGPMEARSTL
jgi:hypothetical protein